MLASMLRTVSSILLILVLILSPIHGEDIGEACTVDDTNNPGVCKTLTDCPVVYQALLAGKAPTKSCGYVGFVPVVCCPTTTNEPSTTEPPIETEIRTQDRNRGLVARAICAENAKAVYGLKESPVLSAHHGLVNVSRCVVKAQRLIVGGKKADPKEFPHMVAVGYGETDIQWLCGGTLISDIIVLTAAHCTYQQGLGVAKWARVGDMNLKDPNDANPRTIRIAERIKHPEYKPPARYHDIAILKLETAVVYDDWARPACLPVDWPDVEDDKVVATGWGRVDWADEEGSDNLLKVTLSLVSHESCNKSYYDNGNSIQFKSGLVNNWQMCAYEAGKDTCQGDSGGPLAVFNTVHECMYNVVGITSVGRWCGSIEPGVYTRVYHYIPWIEKIAWPDFVTFNN